MDALFTVPTPENEPVNSYAPGTPERESLQKKLAELAGTRHDLDMNIGGKWRRGTGAEIKVVQPHNRAHVLGVTREAGESEVADAVNAAKAARADWMRTSFADRAAIFLRAAELIAGPYRDVLNGATMLGQSKTAAQAEIDSACELIDFLRFNVSFAEGIYRQQPNSSKGIWNRTDHRPLDGFVLAITPFNFTAIAGNLPTAPAIMGNTVVWKPSPTQQFAAHFIMKVLLEAGLPPGVINMVTGYGEAVSKVALVDPELGGIHFTGSTKTFQHLWKTVGEHIAGYRSYPRLVGETGGKDFIIAHPSADPDSLAVAMVRGAYEYQGQKCSALSRTYVPASLWKNGVRDAVVGMTEDITYGDVTDFDHFGGAVIDERAYAKHTALFDRLKDDPKATVVAGGTADDSQGYFVQPTLIEATDPTHELFVQEYFGPINTVYVYDDGDFDEVVRQAADIAPYALTGALFATDRAAIARTSEAVRFAAGNYYINDKPTGAVVGQQPFGGSLGSGTNDKAGSWQNLVRWVSPRSIKENFAPPTDYRYPHQG
ncbi:L-glutamate gamma-semialdehyde dehydrogenase [Glycomyces sp. TRM65418]|uniref:L-glutamate gamma-semialdehyde dehydrogenase n=1 Tax=Glycomyces sp. TRM65418 TaxID=2867006 RepID=UPI001CE5824A|nr:L-glutamate gamma-semialdehyde dehydrogenase [Glycomyces sp. TRM65418]MCC3762844.1 L-glutamate gamma-semialdehyde dehydrogenase [Glycomyces sp. TRM65418]QZD56871.1 L-glutamate gamma-semialdehyde dehydrogenase [Glycomyces sp. TRM65418]